MQAIGSFGQRFSLHRNRITEFDRGIFIRTRAPDFAVRHEAAPNFPSVHQWPMVIKRDVRQRDALFDLGSLAYIRQVQIVLCEDRRSNCKNGYTKNKRLKRNCFHNFGGNPSQIFGNPLPVS